MNVLVADAGFALVLLALEAAVLTVTPQELRAHDWTRQLAFDAAGLTAVVVRRRWTWLAVLIAAAHAALPFLGAPVRSGGFAVLVVTYTVAAWLPVRQAVV